MKKNSISEFELEREDFKIKLKRGGNGQSNTGHFEEQPLVAYASANALNPTGATAAIPTTAISSTDAEIKSPMIGTFYRAPSPEAVHYVEVGSEVNPESVVCIIEAMKVMNEIKAECRGVITEVIVENGKPVEFGQPMFRIRPL